jgi:hypothetical protein
VSGSHRVVATETGYHNAVNIPGGTHRPASEAATARYLPRLLFEYFNRGIARTYLYELIDLRNDPSRSVWDQNFGLLRNDGSPKPSFTTLANMTAILRSMGSGPRKSFGYELAAPETVHHTLLSTSDGVVLAIWNEVPSWDNGERLNQSDDVAARRELAVAATTAQLRLDLPARYRVYDPLSGQAVVAEGAGGTIDLAVTDSVRLVRLSPIPELPAPPATTPQASPQSAAPQPAAPPISGGPDHTTAPTAVTDPSTTIVPAAKWAQVGTKSTDAVVASPASVTAERRSDLAVVETSGGRKSNLAIVIAVLVAVVLAARRFARYYRRRATGSRT